MPRVPGPVVVEAAYRAGWRNTLRNSGLTIAVAIARGESGWNTHAHNPVYPDDSYGLWQINGLAHKWIYGLRWWDPIVNGQAAYRVFRQSGFSFRPWTVYTRGVYRGHMDEAMAAIAAWRPGYPVTGVGDPSGGGVSETPRADWDFRPGLDNASSAMFAAGNWLVSYSGFIRRLAGE